MKEITETNYIIKVNLPGGIVAAGDLLEILKAAEKAGITKVSLGNRQQLFLNVSEQELEDLEHEFLIADIEYEKNEDSYPNIISSYVSEDIFSTSNWLREGVYKDILDLFDYQPKLKINLADNNQTFIPFFTGNLNFIASAVSNFWHLHIRFPKTNTFFYWPSLVYTEDIPLLSKLIEEKIFGQKELFYDKEGIDGQELFDSVTSEKRFIDQPITEPLRLPDFQLPYYEGFNKYGNKFWLGIYKRNEEYSVAFLKDICSVCLQTRVGQIYTTPWKSLIIKDINPEDRKLWNFVLAKNRINVRHASNELNWQIEDQCAYGLQLKQKLVRYFDQEDIRTFKLCFAIKTNPKTGLFGSVIIRKQFEVGPEAQEQFDILHTRDFNPNSKDFILYRNNVSLEKLPEELAGLTDYFYDLQIGDNTFTTTSLANQEETSNFEDEKVLIHQCKHCGTIYDPTYGDDLNNIKAGTTFNFLPEAYSCPTCDSPKSDFLEVDKNSLVHL
ncbi:rubredoxin domain-containing protein [Pedobacter sp. SYSU D00535]|uniref:rubredoxin domain-containing protein n=1 Tax=Pedobacter sp. SYSU D00535 TaxID=2810308 RepID=UPI001A95DBA3|nr:rubredoxin domain-containing protein [Pedobacter sp. SYSU D00535]